MDEFLKERLKKISIIVIIISGIFVVISGIYLHLTNYYWEYGGVHGKKVESGKQLAYGRVTEMSTVHGQVWHIDIEEENWVFEYDPKTFDNERGWNTLEKVPIDEGDNILILYEWKKQIHIPGCVPPKGEPDYWHYWTPKILKWKKEG